MSYQTLKQMFTENYNISVTPMQARNIVVYCQNYELRQTHPDALNVPYLGLSKIYFLPKDQAALFDEFHIDPNALKRHILECKTTVADRKVANDPYNVLVIWLAHCTLKSTKLNKQQQQEFLLTLFKMMHYKFFTSRVNHMFPHGANEAHMISTIEELSGKFDIKQAETDTWRKLITKRSLDVIDEHSIHHKTLLTFSDDNAVRYVITDIQTRLGNKIKLITDEFYKVRDDDKKVTTHSISDTIDGEQVIKSVDAMYDQMIVGVVQASTTLEKFIDNNNIKITAGLVKNIRPDMFRNFLIKFSDIAINQRKAGHQDLIEEIHGMQHYVGYKVLLKNLVSKTYSALVRNRDVNMKSKLSILEKVQFMYRASRIIDPGVLEVKSNVDKWVEQMNMSSRAETNTALRIAFIIYITLLTFKHI